MNQKLVHKKEIAVIALLLSITLFLSSYNDFVISIYAVAEATVSENEITIPLKKGWNTISSNIIPFNNSIEAVFSSVAADATVIRDAIDTRKKYNPRIGVNTDVFDYKKAYQVHMKKSGSLTIKGTKADPLEKIFLKKGWNSLSYLPQEPMPIETALASIKDKTSNVVRVDDGKAYIPKNTFGKGKPINDIGDMKPGVGYKIYMKEDAEFSYYDNSILVSVVNQHKKPIKDAKLWLIEKNKYKENIQLSKEELSELPLVQIEVSIDAMNLAIKKGMTDKKGAYKFSSIPLGGYIALVYKGEGYGAELKEISVVEYKNYPIEIIMDNKVECTS
ncbi:MAG: hypothetical protein QMD85_00880, partial [Candidatus Aenigmarchaeota archaeon]|nr:hypothetical protein [Candidatus Aenigmarchaeota archaeon]MDI6722087.1 hypothetical protein [Candidatus Aenigmarchaeota archaeon]